MRGTLDYKTLIEHRLDAMWARYKDSDTADLKAAMRRNQRAGRYLVAGDLAAMRSELEPGQRVRDLGRPRLRRILTDRFEYVAHEHAQGR